MRATPRIHGVISNKNIRSQISEPVEATLNCRSLDDVLVCHVPSMRILDPKIRVCSTMGECNASSVNSTTLDIRQELV